MESLLSREPDLSSFNIYDPVDLAYYLLIVETDNVCYSQDFSKMLTPPPYFFLLHDVTDYPNDKATSQKNK